MDENHNVSVRLLTYEESAFAVFLYTLISVFALLGNLTVAFTILYFRGMRTPTNFLILNLSIADFFMALLCIPFSYWPILILQRWPFGWALCKGISFAQAAVVMSSASTLVAISLDRFVAIICPMKPMLKLTKRSSLIVIISVWLLSVIIAFPLLVVMDLQMDPVENDKWHCVENWTNIPHLAASRAAYHYSIAAMVLQYFFPLIVLIVTYSGIGFRLWYSKVPGEGARVANKGRQDSVKKMIPMMFIVTSTYAICWCPLNVLNILTGIYVQLTEYEYILYVWGCCHFLAMFNSVANPVIYVSRNKKFRDGFRFVFRWFPGVKFSGGLITEASAYHSTTISSKTSECKNRRPERSYPLLITTTQYQKNVSYV